MLNHIQMLPPVNKITTATRNFDKNTLVDTKRGGRQSTEHLKASRLLKIKKTEMGITIFHTFFF